MHSDCIAKTLRAFGHFPLSLEKSFCHYKEKMREGREFSKSTYPALSSAFVIRICVVERTQVAYSSWIVAGEGVVVYVPCLHTYFCSIMDLGAKRIKIHYSKKLGKI